jgi:multicomponent Na+:H+ antiporter subunit D
VGDGPDEIHPNDIREIPLVTIPLVATALLSLVLGIFPDYFLTLARGVVP